MTNTQKEKAEKDDTGWKRNKALVPYVVPAQYEYLIVADSHLQKNKLNIGLMINVNPGVSRSAGKRTISITYLLTKTLILL